MKIIIKSNAKINFGLNIISKRPDGFHNLETLFYPVDLHDLLSFEKASATSLTTDSDLLSSEISDNLIIKAVRTLEDYTGRLLPAKIHLEKKIPMGVGLGGGSSNAACTLLSLNDLYSLKLSYEVLSELAAELGSDVSYFLKPGAAYGESRGEVLTQLDFHIEKPLVLLNPGVHVNTAWAYRNIKPAYPKFRIRELVNGSINDFGALRGKITNDFEEPVFREFPLIRELKEEFYEGGAELALMSGSGSTLFGIFASRPAAEKFADKFRDKFFVFIQNNDDHEKNN